ncbi:hypothetical protein GEMRC1_011246 [Eukaryota sp. GEM-RC1]
MDLAYSNLKKYATAKAIVTSLIHVALPCRGLQTPVMWTFPTEERIRHDNRFKFLISRHFVPFTAGNFTSSHCSFLQTPSKLMDHHPKSVGNTVDHIYSILKKNFIISEAGELYGAFINEHL